MACWIALWPPEPAQAEPLAWWALQFTPRVALVEGQVCLEVYSSRRLFGGEVALLELVRLGAQAWGVPAACVAPHAAAARAWVRAQVQAQVLMHGRSQTHVTAQVKAQGGAAAEVVDAPTSTPETAEHTDKHTAGHTAWYNALQAPLNAWLAPLPLHALPEVAAHADTLSPLGCHTLGDVHRLPRPGLSRRLGSSVLRALDQAWGLKPEAFEWVMLPDTFSAALELPGRLDQAPQLLQASAPLLERLQAWLSARQWGVRVLTLHWRHEFQARSAGDGGACTLRLADATRDLPRLERLLKERLAQTALAGPVGHLRLTADEVAPLPHDSHALFAELASAASQLLDLQAGAPQAGKARQAQQQALAALLEHLAARLGAPQVRRGQVVADHRPECAEEWQAWDSDFRRPPGTAALAWGGPATGLPAPTWLAERPQPLSVRVARGHACQPLHQGALQLLAGPHRLEAGWWDPAHPTAARDYYLAHSPGAGLLWVYQERPMRQTLLTVQHRPQWYLHGWLA